MQEVRTNTHHGLARNNESVEWALDELESATKGCAEESRAREALDLLRRAFRSVRAHAMTDPLTGLANRAWLYQVLDERFASDVCAPGTAAVLFLDLDGFKVVNDQRGHAAGDALLSEVATRIAGSVRDQDLAARHGGDEFVVLLQHVENASIAHAVAARIIEAINVPFTVDGAKVKLGVSVGVAFYPEHGRGGRELLKRADQAMYRAKRRGGRSYAVFGEREESPLPRAPLRSYSWELSRVEPANDVVSVLLKQQR